MADNDMLGKIFSVASAAWTFVLMCAVAIFKAWPNIMGRLNERRRDEASEKGKDWDRRTEEIERLHALLANREKLLSDRDVENDVLRQDRDEWKSRAVTAEAIVQAQGIVRQQAATIVAAERLADTAAKGNGNNGGSQ